MPYKTLMVHLDAGQPNAGVLAVTAALAERYSASVIGIAACEPVQIGYAEGDFSGALAVAERQVVDDELKTVAAEFHACEAIRGRVLDWRSIPTLEPIAHIVAVEARCADLLITGAVTEALDSTRHADTGELVIHAGRPVLIVPAHATTADFATVMLAWADTRECRRAVVDALPLLMNADRVVLAGVGSDLSGIRARIEDVRDWLGRHGIDADVIVEHALAGDAAALAKIADDNTVDLIVAGAYGHNRLAEWAFGGVTRSLLMGNARCVLLSH
ncbi:universal stress protein UspA [Sphingomonas glacialis]|uniref:Universal stress protein UspA n=1 Tax=Sphingomonas glacialis TaxID=658225 RepID=A0ABQ3LV68_9SPHN|nr:universal stress protein [Sphingomonas glacialis]GHH26643.1 universal stress protein UspA [Sphingomonas glacialis]